MPRMSVPYLLDKAAAGERLYFDEALFLYREADLAALGKVASKARQLRVPGQVVTYVIDRTICYTNVCVTRCQFCGCSRSPKHPEAYISTQEELSQKIDDLVQRGGSRLVLQGGHNPDLSLDWYTSTLRWLRTTYPGLELDCFSPSEIAHLAHISNLSIREVLHELKVAGLQGLPGDGAELLEDEVRDRFSPRKQKTDGWLTVMREAQKVGLNTTATMVIGFDELLEQRVRHLQRLRDLQDYSLRTHSNGFHAFKSWTLQSNTSMSQGRAAALSQATCHDYLRHAAIARLFLDNILHHQASWTTQGTEMGRIALKYGLDDFGSISAEEFFVSTHTPDIAANLSEETVHALIRSAGFIAARRDSTYNLLQVFDNPADGPALTLTHDQSDALYNTVVHDIIPLHIAWN